MMLEPDELELEFPSEAAEPLEAQLTRSKRWSISTQVIISGGAILTALAGGAAGAVSGRCSGT